MRVLVTGGTEFVGLHLVRALVGQAHDVTVLNRGRRPARLPPGVATLVADRKDHAALRARLSGARFEAVYDVTYAPTTGDDVTALLDALGPALRHAVLVSTGRVYDHALPIPFSEDTPRTLYWGEYARNKIAAEDALLERGRRSGLLVTIVRPTHVLGPLNTRHNETFFFDRLAHGRPILLPGESGWLRQFGHVEDLAHVMTALLGDPRTAGQAYNVTGEEAVTLVGFVELIAEIMGRSLTLVPVDPARLGRAAAGTVFGQNLLYDCHAVYTTTKLYRELGLRPRFSLASGLAQTYEWYQKETLAAQAIDLSVYDELLRLAAA